MQYALITGGAKGIGKALAEELAERNYDLLLVDIDAKTLGQTEVELSGRFRRKVHTLHLDLTQSDAIDILWFWTRPFHPLLRVVVNNAGYGLNGAFVNIPIDAQLNVIELNIKTQLKIAHRYIPLLKEGPQSYLLNLGSTTSYQPVPYLAVYAASKAFVLSFTRSLRRELRHSPVTVSCLSPGSTDTDFVNRAGMPDHVKRVADRFNMTPQQVGKIAIDGLLKGKAEIVPGFTNKINAWLPKFFPKAFVERIAGNIYEPRQVKERPSPQQPVIIDFQR